MTDSTYILPTSELFDLRRQGSGRARRRGPSPSLFAGIVQGIDLALLVGGSSAWLLLDPSQSVTSPGGILLSALIGAWAALAVMRRAGAYRLRALCSPARQMRRLALALLAGTTAFAAGLTLTRNGSPPPIECVLDWIVINGLLLGLCRAATVTLARSWSASGLLVRRVAVLGAPDHASAFLDGLAGRQETDLHVAGFYHDDAQREHAYDGRAPFLGGTVDLVSHAQGGLLDAVVITFSSGEHDRLDRVRAGLSGLPLDIYAAPDPAHLPLRPMATLGGVPVHLLARQPLSEWQAMHKAIFDRVAAALLLLLLSPLLLVIALLIRLDSPGPVLFRQPRVGYANTLFSCLKFRSMYVHMSDMLADRQTVPGDPRITRVGYWLRRYSLDELPQLVNVLRGEMSLVGPRPHAPNTKAGDLLFPDAVADYPARHRVKPGITGWAQVNGWRGQTTTVAEIEQRVAHDLHYIRNWSLAFDLRILFLTAWRICVDPKAF